MAGIGPYRVHAVARIPAKRRGETVVIAGLDDVLLEEAAEDQESRRR